MPRSCAMTQFNLRLIELVRENPSLYDMTLVSYKDDELKHGIWQNIAKTIGESIEVCRRRWKTFRTRFRKEYLKIDGNAITTSKWAYYELLSFLQDHLRPIEPETNSFNGNQENDTNDDIGTGEDLVDLFAGNNVQDITDKTEVVATEEYPMPCIQQQQETEQDRFDAPVLMSRKRKRSSEIPTSIWETLAQNCSLLNQLADKQITAQAQAADEAAMFGLVVAAKLRRLKDTSKAEVSILKILNEEVARQTT